MVLIFHVASYSIITLVNVKLKLKPQFIENTLNIWSWQEQVCDGRPNSSEPCSHPQGNPHGETPKPSAFTATAAKINKLRELLAKQEQTLKQLRDQKCNSSTSGIFDATIEW